MLAFSLDQQRRYEATTTREERKQRGQVFTPPSVAKFMADLFSRFPKQVKVLDPGAGTGTLAAAVCERVLRLRSPRTVQMVLYETDARITPLLEENMNHCQSVLRTAGHHLTFDIRDQDFILSNPHALEQPTLFGPLADSEAFDVAIMNPPYFKIQKSSAYARIMERIVHGQPNIYALFMAVAADMLGTDGELVAITPRSFCGGLYFRGFRRWFLKRMSLDHIHLFESRKATFRDAKVLQESVITKTIRSSQSPKDVTITTSYGTDLTPKPNALSMRATQIIDDTCGNLVIRIPENPEDARIMGLVESWPKRFTDHGLRVSTGPVVMFRATQFLRDSANGRHIAPLLCVHNVRPFETVWPLQKNGKPVAFEVCTESLSRRLLLPTRNYVLLRRFSAKEERRRLTASCFQETDVTGPYVALENHLNYVYHAERELTDSEIHGIAALFNSALIDRYFRTLSGNTQVNATELRTMNFPDLKTIARIGRRMRRLHEFSPQQAEHIVLDELGIDETLERHLTELDH